MVEDLDHIRVLSDCLDDVVACIRLTTKTSLQLREQLLVQIVIGVQLLPQGGVLGPESIQEVGDEDTHAVGVHRLLPEGVVSLCCPNGDLVLQ